jgi:hypothetical protein
MATKLTAIDYTDAELLALCKQAIAELTVFSSSTFRGKTVTRANLSELLKLREDLEERVNRAARLVTTVYSKHARTL